MLSDNGYKITSSRMNVVKFLGKGMGSFNAYDIVRKASRTGRKLDVVSVYRALSLFERLKIIHRTSNGKYIPCQKFTCREPAHCHHDFTCTSCNRIEEVHVDDRSFLKTISKILPNLSINSHAFHFEGICEKCKKGTPAKCNFGAENLQLQSKGHFAGVPKFNQSKK